MPSLVAAIATVLLAGCIRLVTGEQVLTSFEESTYDMFDKSSSFCSGKFGGPLFSLTCSNRLYYGLKSKLLYQSDDLHSGNMNNKHLIVDNIVVQLENNIRRRGSEDNLTVI